MADVYTVKGSALSNLKEARDRVRQRIGSRHIGDSLTGLSAEAASELANDFLALLDAIDSVTSRAKAQ